LSAITVAYRIRRSINKWLVEALRAANFAKLLELDFLGRPQT
jgi:hypothetical protein